MTTGLETSMNTRFEEKEARSILDWPGQSQKALLATEKPLTACVGKREQSPRRETPRYSL